MVVGILSVVVVVVVERVVDEAAEQTDLPTNTI